MMLEDDIKTTPIQETFSDAAKTSSDEDPERQESSNGLHDEKDGNTSSPILDKTGFPLVPQPSRFKDDPLVC